jgi:hypothetical protein
MYRFQILAMNRVDCFGVREAEDIVVALEVVRVILEHFAYDTKNINAGLYKGCVYRESGSLPNATFESLCPWRRRGT